MDAKLKIIYLVCELTLKLLTSTV